MSVYVFRFSQLVLLKRLSFVVDRVLYPVKTLSSTEIVTDHQTCKGGINTT